MCIYHLIMTCYPLLPMSCRHMLPSLADDLIMTCYPLEMYIGSCYQTHYIFRLYTFFLCWAASSVHGGLGVAYSIWKVGVAYSMWKVGV